MHIQFVKHGLPVVLVFALVLAACKKEIDDTTPPVTPTEDTPATTLPDSVLKDSILYYTRDVYLWHTQVPSTFNAQSFAGPEKLMEGIQPYSVEPGFAQPVDRWSFAMKKEDWDNMSSGLNLLQDESSSRGDFGMSVFFKQQGDLRVRLVEPNSPAGRAGIRRGWRITAVNGSSNISTTNTDFLVKNIYETSSASMTFILPGGSDTSITLAAANYTEEPVYLDTVYNIGGKKIGYLVFNSFLGDETRIFSQFQRVFSKFASRNIDDLVVDLRYNGGGYVSVQEKLANYLVNSSANGGIMMTQQYNTNNKQYNKTTYFRKTGTLNLDRIYFIVSNATASASELLINNLRPYMDVQLVGPSKTHGKPVGYFPIPVGDWYIFPVSFRSVNKNNNGNYFNGLDVNAKVADGLDKDWGDITESDLSSVIRNITMGSYAKRITTTEAVNDPVVLKGNATLEAKFLKVTVDSKP